MESIWILQVLRQLSIEVSTDYSLVPQENQRTSRIVHDKRRRWLSAWLTNEQTSLPPSVSVEQVSIFLEALHDSVEYLQQGTRNDECSSSVIYLGANKRVLEPRELRAFLAPSM